MDYIVEKIRNGDYDSKLPFPHREEFPNLGKDDVKRLRQAYHDDAYRLDAQFKQDALKDVGMADNPSADKIWSKAYADGHSSGMESVYYALVELAELFE